MIFSELKTENRTPYVPPKKDAAALSFPSQLSRILLVLFLILTASAWFSNAAITYRQKFIEVTGVVVDDKGESLPGVSVRIKGKPGGTISDGNGQFKLKVDDQSAILVFSWISLIQGRMPAE